MLFTRTFSNIGGRQYPSFQGATTDRAELDEVLAWCTQHIGSSAQSPADFTSRETAWMYRKSGEKAYVLVFKGETGAFLFGNRWA